MAKNREELENIIRDAALIDGMTATKGWEIIRSYLENTIKLSHDTWLYTDEDNKTVRELKQAARTAHAMINLVENFREEGKRLYSLWAKAQGFVPDVPLDMDNVSPNIEEN